MAFAGTALLAEPIAILISGSSSPSLKSSREALMEAIFGIKDHLSIIQECARAVLIFAYGLAMLRLSGKRTFSQWSPGCHIVDRRGLLPEPSHDR